MKDYPGYPDDVVAVMRDTIEAQREALAAKDQVIGNLRKQIHARDLLLKRAHAADSGRDPRLMEDIESVFLGAV